jgi:enoyl-CoA hydratase/carnithine racemase
MPQQLILTDVTSGVLTLTLNMERNQGRWRILWNLNKPTIAQVHGYCVAGGTDLA